MLIIGAGFGRTGTLSVKAALERLGFGPCYHMLTAFEKPEHLRFWNAAQRGEPVEWPSIFDGYRSTVDWPGCAHWRELVLRYPEAKVVLTVRDPERWYESFRETLAPLWSADGGSEDPGYRAYLELVHRISWHTFGGRLDDKAHVISVFQRHNDSVAAAVPAERLLVHEVKQGWAPLCEFLGTPVPEEEFPHLNDRVSFLEMARRRLAT